MIFEYSGVWLIIFLLFFFYRKFEYIRDIFLVFKKEMEIKEKEVKGGGGSFGGFGGFGNIDIVKDKVVILFIF